MSSRGGFRKMNAESSDTEMSLDETNPERKKYFVNGDRGSSSSSGRFCQKSLTRREWICVIIGATIVAMAIVLFIVIALAFASPMGGTADNQGEPWTEIRLPINLVPQLYTIYLDPDLDTRAVTGTVSMEVFVQLATNNVIFHAKDMNIHRDSVVVTRNSAPLQISNQFNYSTNDFYIITLASQLNANETIIVSMSFNYTLRDDLVGFYRSSYISNNGDKVYLASTQFEPTDARRAFPCFDEPDLKANFSIQLTHPPGYSAVSNMPVKTSQAVRSESTKMKTLFETTYKMSTYLVAFVVSNFECSIPDNSSAIKVRVCSRADAFNSTSYALHVAKIVINYYEEFFDVKYPLPKQDLFAIPDFAAGAMENWGLITYRETAVLYDKSINPAASKQRVTVVIAHELAHQWFGNLVTMEWWDGLWLNEGFASYVEYIGANEAEPSWMMLDQFFHTVQTAFDADGLNWSHPIIQTVDNPDQINALFDSISYSKGASLIQMLRGYLGEDNFRSGLKIYLKAHQFANARTSDLWTALNQVTSLSGDGVTVNALMDTWTKQMGYPVVTISSNGNMATITQDRFLQYPLGNGTMASSPYNYIWTIPFDYITQNSPDNVVKQILSSVQGTIQWRASTDGFIKANVKQNGFYRVNYDTDNWQKIIDHLMISPQTRPQILSAVDRAGLLEDAFALSSAGLLNITYAFEMSRYLKTENHYIPWITGIRWFDKIANQLSYTGLYGKYKRYILSLLTNVIDNHSFNATNLTHLDTLLQAKVLLAGSKYGDDSIAEVGLQMFREWMKNSSYVIPPNLHQIVYDVAIASGGETEWNFLFKWYLTTNNPYEKRLCLSALAKSTQPWILNQYLEYSLLPRYIKSQDTLTVISHVSANYQGRYLAWNFFREHWDELFKTFGGGSFNFARAIRTLTESFATQWELQEVETFFTEHPNAGSADLAVKQSIEIVRGNIKWLAANQATLDNWLSNQ